MRCAIIIIIIIIRTSEAKTEEKCQTIIHMAFSAERNAYSRHQKNRHGPVNPRCLGAKNNAKVVLHTCNITGCCTNAKRRCRWSRLFQPVRKYHLKLNYNPFFIKHQCVLSAVSINQITSITGLYNL